MEAFKGFSQQLQSRFNLSSSTNSGNFNDKINTVNVRVTSTPLRMRIETSLIYAHYVASKAPINEVIKL
jgi:hypothetical protein